jgi:hypothetical protein
MHPDADADVHSIMLAITALFYAYHQTLFY